MALLMCTAATLIAGCARPTAMSWAQTAPALQPVALKSGTATTSAPATTAGLPALASKR